MIVSVDPVIDSILKYLQPCTENTNLIQSAPLIDWIHDDYNYETRSDTSNVGALEYLERCIVDTATTSVLSLKEPMFSIYPNPAGNEIICKRESSVMQTVSLTCRDLTGKGHFIIEWPANKSSVTIPIEHLPVGLYFLQYNMQRLAVKSLKFVKMGW